MRPPQLARDVTRFASPTRGTLRRSPRDHERRAGASPQPCRRVDLATPLHDPIRVAEEWAVVDNISGGRVGLGLACGWVPNDFVISGKQAEFERRKELFDEKCERLRKLWRGDPHHVTNPQGETISLQTVPRPIQKEVPIWITAAANPETFRKAGEMGANVLTHLLGQRLCRAQRYAAAWMP